MLPSAGAEAVSFPPVPPPGLSLPPVVLVSPWGPLVGQGLGSTERVAQGDRCQTDRRTHGRKDEQTETYKHASSQADRSKNKQTGEPVQADIETRTDTH